MQVLTFHKEWFSVFGTFEKKTSLQEGSNSNNLFMKLPDEILVMILCLLPMKDAVVTSSVCKQWKFLWRNLIKLNFDGTKNLNKIRRNRRVLEREQHGYFDQVNGVIQTYNHPVVQEFRIRFHLNKQHQELVDSWLEFAVKKKVEIIDLDFIDSMFNCYACLYDLPLTLFPNAKVVELVSLKQLFLKNVNVTEVIFEEFLTISPHLETISIHGSRHLIHIRVSGRALNLKHFVIHRCWFLKSIQLSDFDLVSFDYIGGEINLNLANLPKLSKLFCQGHTGSENKELKQISSCALSHQDFSFLVYFPMLMLKLDFLPILPNVKKLTLLIGAHEDASLLEFTSIAKACPSLESLTIKLLLCWPVKSARKVRNAATYRHEHLKLFQILGYHGRVCDLELVAYVIRNAVALKKIIIDPRVQLGSGLSTKRYLKEEEDARSSAKRQLVPRTPPGVNLVIL